MSPRSDLVAAAQALAIAVRTSDPGPAVVDLVKGRIAEALDLLGPSRHPGPFACEQLRPPGDGFHFDPADPGGSIPFAPLTGPQSPIAGDVQLRVENGAVVGELTFLPIHAGPMGLVHGGILAAVFDEVMAMATLAHGIVGYTQQMTVDYLAPARLGRPLSVSASVDQAAGASAGVQAEIRDGTRLLASATGRFHKLADLDEDFYALQRARSGEAPSTNAVSGQVAP
ncbi:hypothetical protein GVN24_24990 [Rhizobium sp. CRIBSB]|nr:hypothetical protein [Rhizobium sp. CRIBSB]